MEHSYKLLNEIQKRIQAHNIEDPELESLLNSLHKEERIDIASKEDIDLHSFNEIYKNAPFGIALAKQDGTIINCNQALIDLLHFSSARELMQLNATEFYIFPEERERFIRNIKTHKYIQNYEVHLQRSDKTIINATVSSQFVKLKNTRALLTYIIDNSAVSQARHVSNENERLLDTIFNSIQSGVMLIDPETKHIEAINNFALNTLGYTHEQVLGKTCHSMFCHAKSGPCPVIDNNGFNKKSEQSLYHRSGDIIQVETVSKRILFNDKTFILQTLNDISDLRRKEKELQKLNESLEERVEQRTVRLKQSEEMFRQLSELSPSPVCIQTQDQFLFVNKAWENLSGYSKTEALNMNPIDFITREKQSEFRQRAKNRFEGKDVPNRIEFEVINKYKKHIWLDVSVAKINFDGHDATIATLQDITEAKVFQQELEESEQKFKSLFFDNYSIMLLIDPETGDIVDANKTACAYYGFSNSEFKLKNIKGINTLSPKMVHQEMKNAKEEKRNYFLFKHQLKSGEIRDVEVYSGKVVIEKRDMLYSIIHDITDRRLMEEALIESEKNLRNLNAQKDRFFSIIAHDLKGPVGNLRNVAVLLKERYTKLNSDTIHNFIQHLADASESTFKLIENLLIWSRSQIGHLEIQPELLNLKELIHEAIEPLQELAYSKEIKFEQIINDQLFVYADRYSILTVLRNLTSNAIKFSHRNSIIEFKAESHNKQTYIRVKDNGVGISEKQLKQLFDLHQNHSAEGTEHEKGSGLGLILCKELIEKNKGCIQVKSEKNKGSEFCFMLPNLID